MSGSTPTGSARAATAARPGCSPASGAATSSPAGKPLGTRCRAGRPPSFLPLIQGYVKHSTHEYRVVCRCIEEAGEIVADEDIAETEDDDEAPGWDAIEKAVNTRIKDTEPLHWGTDGLAGQGLYGLSAYRADDAWLLVTFGMTELFGKDSDDPEVSGWGYEFTMRVPRDGDEPPQWALKLLQQLVSYVFDKGEPFADGHRMDPGGPITG